MKSKEISFNSLHTHNNVKLSFIVVQSKKGAAVEVGKVQK